ncbi:hypothetical protein F0U60_17420 [Archangium minus]|uniref:Lipoprotein n=1 Tax=Archangium minus TaxID=83450 RepID=A0ABY9WPF7_9BACT|nr:hypothetical protein F0U60_17420 [Archangium minus]
MNHNKRWFGAVLCAFALFIGLQGTGCGGFDDEERDDPEEYTDDPDYYDDEDEDSSGSGGTCSGSARICASFGSYNCSEQPGCSWSYSQDMCTGFPRACYSVSYKGICNNIKGCNWFE